MKKYKKSLIQICYPLLMVIPICLIYDANDYSYISTGISYIGAWGIGAVFVYFAQYYKKEPRSIREYLNYPLKLRVLYAFPWVSLTLFLSIFIYPIPLISGPFVYLLWLLNKYVIIGIIEIFLLTIVLLIYYYRRRVKVIYPIQRILVYYSIYSFIIYSIIVYEYVLYDSIKNNQMPNTSFGESCIIFGGVYIFMLSIATFSEKEKFYVVIPKVDFCLFLRSFRFDKTEAINSILALFGKENVVQIANPVLRNSDDSFIGYNFFLPTRKWKKELRYYISKARHVYCTIGESEGVQWEMFENEDVCEKFIYHIPPNSNLDNIISMNRNKEEKSLVFNCLQEIRNRLSTNECVFFIRNAQCYCYNNPYIGVESFLSSCPNNYCVKFPVSVSNKLNISTGPNYMQFFYFVKDILRLCSIIIRPRKIIFYLGLFVEVLIVIACLIASLCFLFLSAVGLFMCISYLFAPSFAADLFGISNNVGVFDILVMMLTDLVMGYIGYLGLKEFCSDA